MNVTELLVTGYDGEQPVFVVNLAPDRATTILTSPDDNGDTKVDSTAEHSTETFALVRELLENLTLTPTQA